MDSQKQTQKYQSSNHCKFLCQYHIIWCPKFRYKVLENDIIEELENILLKTSEKYGYEIVEKEIMEDHIHLFVRVKPTVAPIDIIRTLKSISAIELFKKFPRLKNFYKKCGSLWSRGNFISSVGHISQETIIKYIREQKEC